MSKNGCSVIAWGCVAAVFLVSFVAAPGHCKTVTLTYSIIYPATHPMTALVNEWANEIDKRTNGAVKITVFPGSALTPPEQCYDGVVKGICDIGFSVLGYSKGRFPLTEVIDLPLGYKSALQASRLCNAYYKKFHPKEFDDVKIMYLQAHGPGILHTKTAVKTLEGLKGMKVRCAGTSAKIVKALGGTPVAMPQPETYEALRKGVVDGLLSPPEVLKDWKFAEVVSSTTQNYGSSYTLAFFVAMNKKKWESLPKDVQTTIEKINEEWMVKSANLRDRVDREGTEFTLAKGNQVVPLSRVEDERWAKAVRPVLDEYVSIMKAKGLPGKEALDFCLDWLAKNP